MESRRIYLDNAATSWPKPEIVYQAVDRYQREIGAAAGRGAYRQAGEAERLVRDTRRSIAELLGADDPNRIAFMLNATDALNASLHGLLKPGDHVVTTVVEHNSVLRPLRALEEQGVRVTRVGCDERGIVSAEAIRRAIESDTRLIALNHVSNVTGAIQPAAEVGRIAAEHDVLYLLDAAQSLGHVPIDVDELRVDLLAAPGHKGLLGPLGTGLLYVGPKAEEQVEAWRRGGTGTQSEVDRHPDELPYKYEAGNLNVPGIVGLGAGVGYIRERGTAELRQHEQRLLASLIAGLQQVEGLALYGPLDPQCQLGVVSFNVPGYDPQEVAGMLDSACSIQVRAGLHCAPLMHQALGTAGQGGTVRISTGIFTTTADIDAVREALEGIAAARF